MTETAHHRPPLVLGGTGERLMRRDFGDYARVTAATGVWNPGSPR